MFPLDSVSISKLKARKRVESIVLSAGGIPSHNKQIVWNWDRNAPGDIKVPRRRVADGSGSARALAQCLANLRILLRVPHVYVIIFHS